MRTLEMTVALLVFVGTLGTGHAGVLATAPAQAAPGPENKMWCSIVNIDRAPRFVITDILDYAGNVLDSSSSEVLLPNHGRAVGDITGNGVWCRFTVEGSTKKFRAAAVYDDGSAYTVSIPAQ